MASKSKINIVSNIPIEFCNTIRVNDLTYLVQTEDAGAKTCKIITRVYSQGEVVSSRKSDYSHLLTLTDFKKRLRTLMENQHKHTIELFILEQSAKRKSKSDYAEEVKQLLRKGNGQSAFTVLRHAIERFPEDPFLLSYYGCLLAVVDDNPKEGVRICKEAIEMLKGSTPFGAEYFFPVFYLNLGRAYLKDNRKNEAIIAFRQGLENEPQNHDLLWEMKRLGTRKRPLIPFLPRDNPLNKYVGMLIYKNTTSATFSL